MKTKIKWLFSIGLLVALCVGFLIGILVDFPKIDKSEVAGTFGKAEKFHKVTMTAKDIQLRSEFLKDTAQLRDMIQGLVYFSLSTEELSADIDVALMAFKAQGLGTSADEAQKVAALKDYSGFIRNNNLALNTTIAMLTGFYTNDKADPSVDVEKNLRDFGTYVNTLNQKHLVLSEALLGMDNFMLANKTLQAHQTELVQLKSIRDKLLVKGVQLGGLLGNKELVGSLINGVFASQEKLDVIILEKEQLGSLRDKAQLGLLGKEQLSLIVLGKEQLSVIILGKEQLALNSNANPGDAGSKLSIVYDKASLQFLIGDQSKLGIIFGTQNLQVIALFGTDKLNIVMQNYSLQNVMQSQLAAGFSANQSLNIIHSKDNLQLINFSSLGLRSLLNLMSRENLGVIVI